MSKTPQNGSNTYREYTNYTTYPYKEVNNTSWNIKSICCNICIYKIRQLDMNPWIKDSHIKWRDNWFGEKKRFKKI